MEDSSTPDAAPPAAEAAPVEAPRPEPKRARRGSILPWIISLVMLLLGVAIGFEARPVVLPAPTVASSGPASAYPIINLLLSQTRHFKGNANAPVTIIEFSDFQ